MKRARFTKEQIIRILRKNDVGAKAGELARKHGLSRARSTPSRSNSADKHVEGSAASDA
jgi:hypothetical protein